MRERYLVRTPDGEEVEVYNSANVKTRHRIKSVGGHETFEPSVSIGDGVKTPEYVTERLAEYLWTEFSIDVEDHGIDVIDPDADDVEVV